jgi:hypothetical protein
VDREDKFLDVLSRSLYARISLVNGLSSHIKLIDRQDAYSWTGKGGWVILNTIVGVP